MQKIKLLVCLLALLSASCAANGPALTEIVTVDTACKWVKPVLIHRDDGLTDGTARQILAHNKSWEAACSP